MSAQEIMKLDLYGILEVSHDATEKQILKSYRKKALKCHPDKNPDNPNAADLFHKLSEALKVLTDAAARAAYDKILKAREAAAQRHRELNSKRKKFKEDLEARESGAQQQQEAQAKVARNLAAEIERLRKEGSSLLEHEQERLKEKLKKEDQMQENDITKEADDGSVEQTAPRLKLKWKAKKGDSSNGGYDHDTLTNLFSKYGEVTCLLVSTKKNGSAVIEFKSPQDAAMATKNEIGLPSNPLTISWLSGQPETIVTNSDVTSETIEIPQTSLSSVDSQSTVPPIFPTMSSADRDFESVVLMRMRQAEERKRLIEQMQKDD